jgi:hypothetical protein
MCDLFPARFISLYHRIELNDEFSTPLDIWMEQNVPVDYRVISVMLDKMITDQVMHIYHILLERISDETSQ